MIIRRLISAILVVLLLAPAFALPAATPAAAAGECEAGGQYFPETKRCVGAAFYAYWLGHGGLAQQGLPLTDEALEISASDGNAYRVQYFERARFEHHPENADPQYTLLLGLLGDEQLKDKYPDSPPPSGGQCAAGGQLFAETGRCVPPLFYAYWQGHGGLAQQGLPLTDPFMEINPTDGKQYLTQYFERARFEHHPENAAPYDVLLGLLGGEQAAAKFPGGIGDQLDSGVREPDSAPPPTGEFLDDDAKPVLDWSVPNRYEASWNAYARGMTAYEAYAKPTSWAITLNGCASTSRYKITRYTFTIAEVGFLRDWKRIVESPACNVSLRDNNALPKLGLYRVSLTLHTSQPGVSRVLNQRILLRDHLVVSMGDSLASGEGNPDKPGAPGENRDDPCSYGFQGFPDLACVQRTTEWQERRCHRSKRSGHARAAKLLEDASPHSSVTFLSVACSGASFAHLLGEPYAGKEPDGTDEPPQIGAVAALVGPGSGGGGRTIDHLLLSVGVNEFDFAAIIEDCARSRGSLCVHAATKGLEVIPRGNEEKVAKLASQYDALAQELHNELPGIREIYLNDYPADVFKGGGCGYLGDPVDNDGGFYGIDSSEGAEMGRLGDQINQAIRAATGKARTGTTGRWNLVGGLTEAFEPHSYCDKPTWFVWYGDSKRRQGNDAGTAHPNAAGHAHYGVAVFLEIVLANVRDRR